MTETTRLKLKTEKQKHHAEMFTIKTHKQLFVLPTFFSFIYALKSAQPTHTCSGDILQTQLEEERVRESADLSANYNN